MVNRSDYSRIIKVVEGNKSQRPALKKYAVMSDKKIHIIGLGEGGCNALEHIYKQNFEAEYTGIKLLERGFHFIIINFREKVESKGIKLLQRSLSKEMQFISYEPGISVSDHPQGYLEKKLNLPKDIQRLFKPDKLYVLLAGLGGYTGISLVKVLFEYLSTRERDFIAICSYPFKFEGRRRMIFAQNMTRSLKNNSNFISFYLNSVIENCRNISLREAFDKADMEVYRILKTTVNLS